MTEHPLILREKATSACRARFDLQPLDFKERDCVRLVRLALVKQGVSASRLLKGLRWGTRAGAKKALANSGFNCLSEGVDAVGIPRIPPARVLPGDIVALPVPEGDVFGCSLCVSMGGDLVLGLDGQGVFRILRTRGLFKAAWRTLDG